MKKFLSAKSGFVSIRSNHFRVTCTAFVASIFQRSANLGSFFEECPLSFLFLRFRHLMFHFLVVCSKFRDTFVGKSGRCIAGWKWLDTNGPMIYGHDEWFPPCYLSCLHIAVWIWCGYCRNCTWRSFF